MYALQEWPHAHQKFSHLRLVPLHFYLKRVLVTKDDLMFPGGKYEPCH